MLLGFQFRILLILREMQTKSTPSPPFFGKNREIFFFNRIHLLLQYIRYDYVCKSSTFANVIFKGKCLQNNCHKHYM